MISFIIPITPVPKGRPRVGPNGAYTPATTRKFEKEFRAAAAQYAPPTRLRGPLHMTVIFTLPRPKKPKFKWPVRSDLDNFIKAVADSMNMLMYVDDVQIVSINAAKKYADPGAKPSIYVMIQEVVL